MIAMLDILSKFNNHKISNLTIIKNDMIKKEGKGMFTSILRQPDCVTGATQDTAYRFEEKPNECNVKFEYQVCGNGAKVVVCPSEQPVQYLKLRFNCDFSLVDKVYGDYWARCSYIHPLEWKNVLPERQMPWYCYLMQDKKVHCYGVKTGADCFASWYVDPKGISLFLDLSNGTGGTDLKQPLVACEVVETESLENESSFSVAKRFAKIMCEKPVLPKQPIFGVNNWYWAYGDISAQSVLLETDYLIKMTKGTKNRPYMIIDDGWQKNRTVGTEGGTYIGGEWLPNEKFKDMKALCDKIHEKGANAGLWIRPLLTRENIPEEQVLTQGFGGTILDPSHPENLKKIGEDVKRIKEWGFDLIKHDFTQIDTFGSFADGTEVALSKDASIKDREFYDKTKTNATIIKNLYKTIQESAGEMDVIGCNVFGHLSAGIHSIHRVGADTSGRAFEITRSDGINSMMRLPQNKNFYLADPDCAAFTKMVDSGLNLDFLEMCAITGVTTLASVTPNSLTEKELKRINEIFKIIDRNQDFYDIKNYDKTCCPDTFINEKGEEKSFDWYRGYKGVRAKFAWVED